MHRLILADDSKTIQKVIRLSFAAEEVEILCFEEGEAALEQVLSVGADVVLADVSLPGIDGYELCRRLKEDERSAGIPVVLLASAFEPFDEGQAVQAHYDAVLTKPFDTTSLVSCVNELLSSRQPSQMVSEPEPEPVPEPVPTPELFAGEGPAAGSGAGFVAVSLPQAEGEPIIHLDLAQCLHGEWARPLRKEKIQLERPAAKSTGLTTEQFDRLVCEVSNRLSSVLRDMLPDVTRTALKD